MPVVAGPPQAHGPSTFEKSEHYELTIRTRIICVEANGIFSVKMGAMMGTCMSIRMLSF